MGQALAEAIEHREDNWSRRRLLLDVGATDAHDKAHVLTDGLAGAESRMIGIIGLYQKSARERNFPLGLLEKGLKVKIEAAWILNSIALPRLETCDFEHLESYPEGDPNFQRVDKALAAHFALASWYGFLLEGREPDVLARAVTADGARKIVELSFTGSQNFGDRELEVLVGSLPAELRVLRLDLAFSGLETLDMFETSTLTSLVQLKLRFTGSAEFRTAAGLGVALGKMKKLIVVLGFMNLPRLEELGCLSSALLSLRKLEVLVLDLSGCGHVSLEARMDLQQAIKSLKWLRGSDIWVNIEGLPNRSCFPVAPVLKSMCSRRFRVFQRQMRQIRQIGTRKGVSSVYFEATRFGRSSASSDESEETEPEVYHEHRMFDENRPYPCSHLGCSSFHACEQGYCEKHRWSAKRICVAANAWRQNVELVVLIVSQAVAEVESRYLLLLIVVSLLPVASYSVSQSTGVPGTAILVLLVFPASCVASIAYTTARLNRMHDLSMKLEVEAEALYARSLQTDMSKIFGDYGRDDVVQPHISTLEEHFIEAGKEFHNFDQHLCLPLREFLEEQLGFISLQEVRPVLMTLPLAQDAVVRERDPGQILDLLYCNVDFDDWEKMVNAWRFLKSRVDSNDLGCIELVRIRDSFALAHAGVRCAEMVVKINNYMAAIRFREASLTRIENQLDDVHHLAQQVGLVAGPLQFDLRISARPQKSWSVIVAVSFLRVVSLLAAMYLGGQYFVRYSPLFIRSELPQLFKDAFALKQETIPHLSEAEASDFEGWFQESLLPSIVFSLPYLALMIVLLNDLFRCWPTKKMKPLKPTQLLYEEYFGLQGKLYGLKVAVLQIFTVMLQAFGKIQILGGLVSFAFHAAPGHLDAFQGCFWAFIGFLVLNSVYPSILLAFPSVKWIRLGAAVMDAVLDIAYTSTYLIISVLAIYELRLDEDVSGNFGDEASANFTAELDPGFAFPSDFLGFFAVYYSLAHVCTVCRALERNDRKLPQVTPYSPFLLATVAFLLLSSHFYPVDVTDFGCFPCRCWPKDDGWTKHLASCSLVGVLSLKEVSLREQRISSVAEDAFEFSRGLQRLSLSKNHLVSLTKNLFAPLDNLELLDLGELGLQHLESDTFRGLASLRILSLSQNRLEMLPEGLLRPMPGLQQLLLGGKSREGKRFIDGNELSVLPDDLLECSPRLQVLDLSENRLNFLPKGVFDRTSLLRTLDLGSNHLNELPVGVFDGLSKLEKLDLGANKHTEFPVDIFAQLSNLKTLDLGYNKISKLPAAIFGRLSKLQTLDLQGNNLSALPAKVFSGLSNLKKLDIGRNKLSELPPKVFEELQNLEWLDLPNNRLFRWPAEVFAGLISLQTLNLLNNKPNWPNELPPKLFEGLSNLRTLDLRSNEISVLPNEIFAGLHNLQTLNLRWNGLSVLTAEIFEDLSNLKMLDLKYNEISKLHAKVFRNLSNLETLDLQSNNLRVLPPKVFEGLRSLQTLVLKNNAYLGVLPAETFAELSRLEKLVLRSIGVSELPADIFTGLSRLKFLDLGFNYDLKELPVDIFAELGNLQELDLQWNYLSELPADVFAGPSSLQKLVLRHNGLRVLPADVFAGLRNLQVLDLSSNDLPYLPTNVLNNLFAGLNNLRTLELDECKLSRIPAEVWANESILAGLTNLRELSLESNELSRLPPQVLENMFAQLGNLQTLGLGSNGLSVASVPLWSSLFSRLGNLKVLGLQNQQLSEIPAEAWPSLFREFINLEMLNLDECELSELPLFVGLVNLQTLSLKNNRISVLPAESFMGLPNLQTLSLSNNRLSTLPAEIFWGLSNLQTLALDWNHLKALPPKVFEGLVTLQNLQLGHNDISKLPVQVFAGLSNLQELRLHSNKLTELPDALFVRLNNLHLLTTWDNALRELPAICSIVQCM
eukprot:Skav220997  [mRNA]  locus=scaffold2318:23656:30497:+ [translate_table: standard]